MGMCMGWKGKCKGVTNVVTGGSRGRFTINEAFPSRMVMGELS